MLPILVTQLHNLFNAVKKNNTAETNHFRFIVEQDAVKDQRVSYIIGLVVSKTATNNSRKSLEM